MRAAEDLYAWLPLATIIDNKIFVVHGGVSDSTNLKDIAAIDRHKVRLIPIKQHLDLNIFYFGK